MESLVDSSDSSIYSSDEFDLDALSVSTAAQWNGVLPHACTYGYDCDDDCTGFDITSLEREDNTTCLETAKPENLRTDKVDLEAKASFGTSCTAFSYNTESFISVGEMRGRSGPGMDEGFGIRERSPALFKSFYQDPELNELDEYEDWGLPQKNNLVFDKPSQYEAEEMRDYTVCHTHPYWLKVQDQRREEPHQVTSAHSVYFFT